MMAKIKRKPRAKSIDRKSGRPRLGEEHLTIESYAPWLKLGISRRTYYRHKKAGAL